RASAPRRRPLAIASSSSAREAPIHAPRPGALARTSGNICPSGASARRIRSPRVSRSPERMHLRNGAAPARSREGGRELVSPSVSLGRFRMRVLPGFGRGVRRRGFVLEPVRAGGHDDLVALLVGEAVFGEHAALV